MFSAAASAAAIHAPSSLRYAGCERNLLTEHQTFARFIHAPERSKAGEGIRVTGIAQSGMSGLGKVQVWLQPRGEELPEDDPYFTKANWQDAEILGPPDDWGGGLPDGKLPPVTRQVDAKSGKPEAWPPRNAAANWAILLAAPPAGQYFLALPHD